MTRLTPPSQIDATLTQLIPHADRLLIAVASPAFIALGGALAIAAFVAIINR